MLNSLLDTCKKRTQTALIIFFLLALKLCSCCSDSKHSLLKFVCQLIEFTVITICLLFVARVHVRRPSGRRFGVYILMEFVTFLLAHSAPACCDKDVGKSGVIVSPHAHEHAPSFMDVNGFHRAQPYNLV